MVPFPYPAAELFAGKTPGTVWRSWRKRNQFGTPDREDVAVGCKPVALLAARFLVFLNVPMIQHLDFNALGGELARDESLQSGCAGPDEHTGIAAGFHVPPPDHSLEIGEGLHGPHDPDRLASATNTIL